MFWAFFITPYCFWKLFIGTTTVTALLAARAT